MEVDEVIVKALVNDEEMYIAMHFSDSEPYEDGCDACIDYTTYDAVGNYIDGGQVDYNSNTAMYSSVADAIEDVLEFIFDLIPVEYTITDMSEEDLQVRGFNIQ